MIYVDTSVLVAAFTNEPRAGVARQWLEHNQDVVTISDWVITEFSSAIARKVRERTLSRDDADVIIERWHIFITAALRIPVTSGHFDTAARMCGRSDTALRAGDALHLAIAVAAECEMATFDFGLAAAARRTGVEIVDLEV